MKLVCLVLALFLPLLASLGHAQTGLDDNGDATGYMNFESPQVKPITVAELGGVHYVLACNTPDNAIEVRRGSDLNLEMRIPVDLEPISVVWRPTSATSGYFYSCNFVGDSISMVELSSNSLGRLGYRAIGTQNVDDEPMHLAVLELSKRTLIAVTLATSSGLAYLDADTLELLTSPVLEMGSSTPPPNDVAATLLVDNPDVAAAGRALTQPRTIARISDQMYVMGSRGAPIGTTTGFDILRTSASSNVGQFNLGFAGLGTTPFNMTSIDTPSGSLILAVSGSRPDPAPVGEVDARNVPTGFVGSFLTVLNPDLTIVGQRDLNMRSGVNRPVGPRAAVAQPMDVVGYLDSANELRVFFTSFGTDRLGIVTKLGAAPEKWIVRTIGIKPLRVGPHRFAGPRGLALAYDVNGSGDDLLYILNRVDNSIVAIDAASEQVVARRSMQDPTPTYIRDGRRYLYDARLSRTGFVSCASCHIDARLDGLTWDLSTFGGGSDGNSDLAQNLVRGIETFPGSSDLGPFLDYYDNGFPLNKGLMVTQSLQGLVNYETGPDSQDYFTNAPYHWRGDRETFNEFLGAFEALMGGRIDTTVGAPPSTRLDFEVSTADMEVFTRFINSVAYPPNPEQSKDRLISDSPSADPGIGPVTGIQAQTDVFQGLEDFLGEVNVPGRSCIQCHFLPEGSNNKINQELVLDQPGETAALRGIRQKEGRYVPLLGLSVAANPSLLLYGTGLLHEDLPSADILTIDIFTANFPSPEGGFFVRQFDTGVAPGVGMTDAGDDAGDFPRVELFEDQALEGNVGIAVHVFRNTAPLVAGYWFDPTLYDTGLPYRPLAGGTALSRPALLAMLNPADPAYHIAFHCTPLGSERRLAHPAGAPLDYGAGAPTSLELLPMASNTAYQDIPTMPLALNYIPDDGIAPMTLEEFLYDGFLGPLPGNFTPELLITETPLDLRALRLMQNTLNGSFGVTGLRHEPPRRLRVRGDGICHGAILELDIAGAGQQTLRLPLFAANPTGSDAIWLTAVELDALLYYALMLGGPGAAGVAELFMGTMPGEVAPIASFPVPNEHTVRVINPDGSSFEVRDQAVTLD